MRAVRVLVYVSVIVLPVNAYDVWQMPPALVLPCALLPPHLRLSLLARGFEEDYSALSAHSDSHLSGLQLSFIGLYIYKHRGTETQRFKLSFLKIQRKNSVTL